MTDQGEGHHGGFAKMFPKTLSGKLMKKHSVGSEEGEEVEAHFPRNITMRAKERVEKVMSEVTSDKPHSEPPPVDRVEKSDEEWALILNEKEFSVLRKGKVPEPSLKLGMRVSPERHGIFLCRCCNEPLFSMNAQAPSQIGYITFSQGLPGRTKLESTGTTVSGMDVKEAIKCLRCDACVGVTGFAASAGDAQRRVSPPMQVWHESVVFLEALVPANSKRLSTRIGFAHE